MRFARVALGSLLLSAPAAYAQQYVISTYAGGAPLPAPASDWDVSLTADAAGNQYFASQNSVFKRDQNGAVTRVAGTSRPGYSGDGGPATSAQLSLPWDLAIDAAGDLFIADLGNNRIRKVSSGGIITTVAGNGARGFSGDGGPATSAALSPVGVAVDGAGNLFIADAFYGISLNDGCCGGSNRVRRVSPDGIITTVAGGGESNPGDGGPATSALLSTPYRVAVDSAGNLFIAEPLNGRIRKVSPDGMITTVAGNRSDFVFGGICSAGSSGNGGPATGAQLCMPFSVAVDSAGNLFIAEFGYRCCYDIEDPVIEDFAVRQVSPSGIITTVSAGRTPGLSVCNCADVANASMAVDSGGNLFFSDSLVSRKISPDGTVTTILDDDSSRFSGDGGPATSAQLWGPKAVAADGAGNLFIADTNNNRIRKVSPDGIITTVAGSDTFGYSGDGGPAANAQLNDVTGIALDRAGNLFLADSRNYRVRKVSPDGMITTVAGGGMDFVGNGGPATDAQLYGPNTVAVDGAGNLFILDYAPYVGTVGTRIRKVSPSGIITTVAGGGQNFPGDGGRATDARLNSGQGLAVDGSGNLFLADNGRIRKISPDGFISTVAGNGGFDYSGDGGPATSAQLSSPNAVAVDGAGTLFIADGYRRIRKVSPDGIITTVAGATACCSSSGDDGPAANAQLSPVSLAVDGAGNVYVVDASANAVRILRPANQSVLIGAVVDAASQRADPVSPGKIVVIYGQFGTDFGGTAVSFNGIAAPVLYASATQVTTVVPYAVTGTTAQVKVTYQGQVSDAFTVPVAPSAPSLFASNQTGAGQAAAFNAVDGTANTAANPVKIGDSISLYATGEAQTAPAGVDGKLGGSVPAHPLLQVSVTVGGIPAPFQYAGGVEGQVAGLMQVKVQIPSGVQPGGYVPVVLRVGDASTTPGAVWIAVSGN